MSAKIGSLNVDVTLETARFKTGVRQVQAETSRLEKSVMGISKVGGAAIGALAGFGGAVVLGGLQSAVSGAFELASSMSEAAGRIGVTVEALQALRVAATDNGVSNEALESSMARLNVQLGDLQAGSKTATKAFDAIGLSATALKGLSPDEAFSAIADKIAAIKDPTLQAAAAQDIFGKSYAQLLPLIKGGSEALREAAEESRRNGQISTQDAKDLDYLADSWEKLKVRVGVATAQIIARAARMPSEIKAGFQQIGAFFTGLIDQFTQAGRDIVAGLARGIKNAPGAVWDALKGVITSGIANAKALLGIRSPSRVFMEIGEYIGQGLAIGIEGGETRVSAATRKLTESARRAAEETKALFARLFPEIEDYNRFNADRALIASSGRTEDAQAAARQRLLRSYLGSDGKSPISAGLADAGETAANFDKNVEDLAERLAILGDKATVTTVRVAKSFKDMASETIASMQRLADSIKGGGFLGILEAVIGLGLQLGSIGVFGKKIAANINQPRGYATGTPSAARGMALVGERGPELVRFRGGERVWNNRDTRSMMGGGSQIEIIPSPYFDVRVDGRIVSASPAIMQGGSRIAQSRMAYRQTRRVA